MSPELWLLSFGSRAMTPEIEPRVMAPETETATEIDFAIPIGMRIGGSVIAWGLSPQL